MTDETTTSTAPTDPGLGWEVCDAGNRRIGRVDAVFADYLLIRTRGLLPVDLYVPRTAVTVAGPRTVAVTAADADEAYDAWHRPLKEAPHD